MTTQALHVPTRFGQPADCRNCPAKLTRRGNSKWWWTLNGKPQPWCETGENSVKKP